MVDQVEIIHLTEDNAEEVAETLGVSIIDVRMMYFMAQIKRVEEFPYRGRRIRITLKG